jgi:hypothetical protein
MNEAESKPRSRRLFIVLMQMGFDVSAVSFGLSLCKKCQILAKKLAEYHLV